MTSSRLDRRGLIRGALATGVAATGLTGAAAAAAPVTRKAAGVTLRWLGVAGWELAFDGHVVYFDPYLSRFDYAHNGGRLAADPAMIDGLLADGRLTGPPEVILVSHGHWDHLSDVPTLLNRPQWSGATINVVGTDTARNLLVGLEVPADRLARYVEAFGGEDLVFGGGAYRVKAIRSLHSQSAAHGYAYPGVVTAKPPVVPVNINELVEGGTLAYLVTVPDRLSVLFFGGTNFVERELEGLRPDVVMVCMTDFSTVYRYLERLLTVLGGPRYVIPVHHDDMVTGYDDPNLPNTVNPAAAQALKNAVAALKLKTEVLTPAHLEPLVF
jgi:L-ascorbate metabolism protein UlaG (beta-lactamase superfamily)